MVRRNCRNEENERGSFAVRWRHEFGTLRTVRREVDDLASDVRVLRLLDRGRLPSQRRADPAHGPERPEAGHGILPGVLGPPDGYSPVISFSFAKKLRF